MYESECQLRNAVRFGVWVSHELNPDRVGWQLHVLDKMSDPDLVLCREQGQGLVGLAMPAKGLWCVLCKRMFHAQRAAQGELLVGRAVAEVKVQRNFFCDSAAHKILLLTDRSHPQGTSIGQRDGD